MNALLKDQETKMNQKLKELTKTQNTLQDGLKGRLEKLEQHEKASTANLQKHEKDLE